MSLLSLLIWCYNQPSLAWTSPVSNYFSWSQRCSSHWSSTVSGLFRWWVWPLTCLLRWMWFMASRPSCYFKKLCLSELHSHLLNFLLTPLPTAFPTGCSFLLGWFCKAKSGLCHNLCVCPSPHTCAFKPEPMWALSKYSPILFSSVSK